MVRTRRSLPQHGFELLNDDVKELIANKLLTEGFDPRLREVCHAWERRGDWIALAKSKVPRLAANGALIAAAEWAYCVMNGIRNRPAFHDVYNAIYEIKFRNQAHRSALISGVPPLVLRFAAVTGARGERGTLADKTLAKVLIHVVELGSHNVGVIDTIFDMRRPDLCSLRIKLHKKVQKRLERQRNARSRVELGRARRDAAAAVLEQGVFEEA